MREAYHDQLETILEDLVTMTRAVRQATQLATDALMSADAAEAERVIAGDAAVDTMREQIEESSFELLARQQPVAGDLRMLVAALRMVADLERMGDLAVHIAKVARLRYPDPAIPPVMEGTIRQMAEVAEVMVSTAAHVVETRDVDAAMRLEARDEEMDQLRRQSFRTLLGDEWKDGIEPAVDIALLGRYYERIADHAVSMGRRVVYLVTGEHPAPTA
ncbi:MAG: phosphate signaling complex protein PhoU [Propionibacteriales bacterium]|nr:phosphate signaling complex protein PhoU [Propionibacteriales bacterium]